MRVVGFAAHGQPVIYTNFSQAHDRKDTEMGMNHLMCVLEHCADSLRRRADAEAAEAAVSGGAVSGGGTGARAAVQERWVLIVDYDGFGLQDCNPKAMMGAAKLLANYPERLDTIIMLNAPWAFWG